MRQGQCHLIIYQYPLRDTGLESLFCLCLCQDMIDCGSVTQMAGAKNLSRSQLLLFQTSAVIWTPAAAKSLATKMPRTWWKWMGNAAHCIWPSACSPLNLTEASMCKRTVRTECRVSQLSGKECEHRRRNMLTPSVNVRSDPVSNYDLIKKKSHLQV